MTFELHHLMRDKCRILFDLGQDTSGREPKPLGYEPGDEMPCTFNPRAGDETTDGAQTVVTDATASINKGIVVTNRDRFRLTQRNGVPLLVPEDFRVVGRPQRMPSRQMLMLRSVTGPARE